jgi:RNA polymerase sigma-54 factor
VRLQLSGRLEQQQVLAPQLILSMDILQLGVADLEARIQQEFTENPALELVDPTPGEATTASTSSDEETRRLLEIVDRWEKPMTGDRRQVGSSDASDAKHEALMNTADRPESLEAFLLRQLQMVDLDQSQKRACEMVCGNLDEKGWFIGSCEDLALCSGVSVKAIEQALQRVRQLDPPGIGAVDLADCLLLQLGCDQDAIEYRIVAECLQDLLENSLPRIAQTLKVSLGDVQEACDLIRQLDPDPGSRFVDTSHLGIVPEITIDEVGDRFVARLSQDRLPDLRISPACTAILKEPEVKKDVAEYIRTRVEGARWLIHAIDQRRRTLLDIAQAIVDRQQDFLRDGVSQIQALTMQEIADATGVHISTVSRSSNGKYMQTSNGVIELRRLFTGGVVREDGKVASRDSICESIRDIVGAEDTNYPLSDTQLTNKLTHSGVKIARRTVTKYRERAGIPQAKLRKRYIA